MRARLRKASYFDPDTVAGDILAACRQMWRDWSAQGADLVAEARRASG
jgi:hypothetical protein